MVRILGDKVVSDQNLIMRFFPLLLLTLISGSFELGAEPWVRHVIDNSSRGADGVRLADINGDGLPDITTGWEEGGVTRVYLHPGYEKARNPWPKVTVGRTPSVEDAVFADVNADGAMDVVACCEGKEKAVHIFLSPSDKGKLLDAKAWRKHSLAEFQGTMRWMFAVPLEIDGEPPVELFVAGKNGAAIGYFDFSSGMEDVRWRELAPAGWVMSIIAHDMDDDGDVDIFFTDRKESRRGCRWLENPGVRNAKTADWADHKAGGTDREVMFAKIGDFDGKEPADILVAVKDAEVRWIRKSADKPGMWSEVVIPYPGKTGRAKAVAMGDIEGDGRNELVVSCESADGDLSGVVGLRCRGDFAEGEWEGFDISGPKGVKFDRIELLDLDGDGDLDVLTCEERASLGVIWYENPHS